MENKKDEAIRRNPVVVNQNNEDPKVAYEHYEQANLQHNFPPCKCGRCALSNLVEVNEQYAILQCNSTVWVHM